MKKSNLINLLRAGVRLLDKDPKYMHHQETVQRIRVRFHQLTEKNKGRVA